MDIADLKKDIDLNAAGSRMYDLVSELYPICRSITGNGLRKSLDIVKKQIPLEIREVPSGTTAFDWTVPKEWNIRDAYVKNSKGERVIDFRHSNLHVVGYSTPIHAEMSLSELKDHFYTLPEHPEWIPYRTSYYKEAWGFCLPYRQFLELPEEDYEVLIDSTLEAGYLSYGECVIKGRTEDEVLLSCHVCHPSLCNDNLSGIALQTVLGRCLSSLDLRYSYRLLFIPGTIGSITWLSLHEKDVHKIKHGLVMAGVGDRGQITYKRSRRGEAEIDRAMEHWLKHCGQVYSIEPFVPYGYDERQYGSPGFNLPIGCFQRTPFGQYPQYHTSADDLTFVSPEKLSDSLAACLGVLAILEKNSTYLNTCPKCEPQLGKRGLYAPIGGNSDAIPNQMALLWVLNLSDGEHDLLDIAERADMDFDAIELAACSLIQAGLLKELLEHG